MVENGIVQARGEFAATFETAFKQIVLAAEPVRLLSTSDDKRLEVVADVRGSHFVRRSYGPALIGRVQRSGIGFDQAWTEMHQIFETAGINVVPSVVVHQSPDNKFPIFIASKLVEGVDMRNASVSAKSDAARGLGNVLNGSGKYLLSLEAVMPDMFKAEKDSTGTEKPVLIDVDPYLLSKDLAFIGRGGKDAWYAAYIKRVSQLMWDSWCKPNEREEVISAFLRAITPAVKDMGGELQTLDALMVTHAMSQGMDLRGF